jgi:hypothetical protein
MSARFFVFDVFAPAMRDRSDLPAFVERMDCVKRNDQYARAPL